MRGHMVFVPDADLDAFDPRTDDETEFLVRFGIDPLAWREEWRVPGENGVWVRCMCDAPVGVDAKALTEAT